MNQQWGFAAAVVLGLAGGVDVPAEEFRYPLTAAATKDGEIYVADRRLPGIWKVAAGKLEIYFQASPRFRTPLNAVRCVALDRQGRLLAGDSSTREVYRFGDSGEPQPLTGGKIGIPMDIVVDSAGDLFVTDLEVHRIWKVPAEGGAPREFVAVEAPRGITIDGKDRLWVVTHSPKHSLVRIGPDAKIEPILEGGKFEFPHEVALSDDETAAFVTDGYAKAVWKVSVDGDCEQFVSGDPFQNPVGITRFEDRFLIVDPRARGIFNLASDGKISKVAPQPAN